MENDVIDINLLHSDLLKAQEASPSASVTVFLTSRKPLRLAYQIDTFEVEREYATTDDKKQELEKKLEMFHGMYATFGFSSRGKAQFNGMSFWADLQVNALNSSDFVKFGKEGRIGDGWFKNREFQFRLYISPSMVKDMLLFKSIYEKSIPGVSSNETDMLLGADGDISLSSMYGYDPSLGIDDPFFFLRLEIQIGASCSHEAIGFSINKLYMQ